ncbi:MAG: lipoprotein NlpI [Colwellia sp.]
MNQPNKLLLIFCFIAGFSALQGCASSQKTDKDVMPSANLVIVEPLAINYKSELAIARLSEVIYRVEITDQQRAQLFYDRGVLFDSVGLLSLARLDFSRALQLDPKLVDAYNFLGIHFTQLNEFSQAYEKFDSAIELNPEHEYAYLNRGIALYYGDRLELAIDDFETFHHDKTNDPYRVIWLFIAEYQLDKQRALANLAKRQQQVADTVWAKQIIALYLDEISQEQFINGLTYGAKSRKELTDRLCEAYFYLAKYNQHLGRTKTAENFFKLSLSTNVYEFVEHRYAKLELNLMRTKMVK